MRRVLLLSLGCVFVATLAGCKQQPVQESAVKNPSALKSNCDFLLQRFDLAVANEKLCDGINRATYAKAKSFMVGAVVQSVSEAKVQADRTNKTFYEYQLQLKGKQSQGSVYTFSAMPLKFLPGDFYAVDMTNICLLKVLQQPGNMDADLISSFDVPSRIACK